MSDDRTVTFKLNGKRPDDFTIERLAQYLRALGDLVGSPGNVRIQKITPGSVKVQMAVDGSHYPKFVDRLTSAKNPTKASGTVRKVVSDLENMVSEDHVTAEVTAGRTKLFHLRGYTKDSGPLMGPIVQRHLVRGQIIGLEGKDATKHVRIAEYGSGRELRGDFRDTGLGALLAKHLWGDVVELAGTARLMRHPDGVWELKGFRIDDVQELDDALPSTLARGLRQAFGATADHDPIGQIKKIRG